jgi:hypothetical protein
MASSMQAYGGQHETIGPILEGRYELTGKHHGKVMYSKTDPKKVSVALYFWDDRDGNAFSGWWFSPYVGSTMVWAYAPSDGDTPPEDGWQLPFNSTVDYNFFVLALPSLTPAPPPPPASYTHKSLRADGRTRTKKKPVLDSEHPLVKKRKQEAAINRM